MSVDVQCARVDHLANYTGGLAGLTPMTQRELLARRRVRMVLVRYEVDLLETERFYHPTRSEEQQMSLKTTATELRERARDLRRSYDNEDLGAHLRAMAAELDAYPSEDDLRLIVNGGAKDQAALDAAVERVRVSLR